MWNHASITQMTKGMFTILLQWSLINPIISSIHIISSIAKLFTGHSGVRMADNTALQTIFITYAISFLKNKYSETAVPS